ncbi:MAG: hypothetical protein EP329_10050 [Deltaproteobacteria bacterium]|nr:MAG: hypothetical protein EP329_10050 [Deltaproteobacteria bacterium]
MSRRASLCIGLVPLLTLATHGCDQAPWAEGEGRIAIAIEYAADGRMPNVDLEETVVLRTADGREQHHVFNGHPNGWTSMSLGTTMTAASPPSEHTTVLVTHDGLPCDPAAGPVEVIVSVVSSPAATSTLEPIIRGEERVTVPCRANWENGGRVRFGVVGSGVGELRVRVALDAPPVGVTDAVAVLQLGTRDGNPETSAAWLPQRVGLMPEGERLTGEWRGRCQNSWTRRVFARVGALTAPGLDPAEVWAVWPPPPAAEAEITCVPGETREVTLTLAPAR